MEQKKSARLRRACRARSVIRELTIKRLSVHRTPKHIYAQIIDDVAGKTLVAASSLDKEFKEKQHKAGNVSAACEVGKLIAERAKELGVTEVAFDRSGFKYHGRVKALADSAREAGLKF